MTKDPRGKLTTVTKAKCCNVNENSAVIDWVHYLDDKPRNKQYCAKHKALSLTLLSISSVGILYSKFESMLVLP